MTAKLSEHAVTCPSCWERHTLVLDDSEASQTYIEDCSVCCHPMTVTVVFESGADVRVDVEAA